MPSAVREATIASLAPLITNSSAAVTEALEAPSYQVRHRKFRSKYIYYILKCSVKLLAVCEDIGSRAIVFGRNRRSVAYN